MLKLFTCWASGWDKPVLHVVHFRANKDPFKDWRWRSRSGTTRSLSGELQHTKRSLTGAVRLWRPICDKMGCVYVHTHSIFLFNASVDMSIGAHLNPPQQSHTQISSKPVCVQKHVSPSVYVNIIQSRGAYVPADYLSALPPSKLPAVNANTTWQATSLFANTFLWHMKIMCTFS